MRWPAAPRSIACKTGADVITGGAGRDTFVVGSLAEAADTITDFTTGEDILELNAAAFNLAGGTVTAGQNFSVIGDAYTGANAGNQASLVYSTADHALYYDGNGSDPGGYSVVVTLQPGATLTATDIHLLTQVAA